MAQSAAQAAAQRRLVAASKTASKKGLKGAAFKTFVGNATRGKGGGGKTKAKAKPKGKALTASNPGTTAATTNNKNHRPRGGATYQAVKVTGQAAMPLTDYALSPGAKSVDGLTAHLKARANINLAKGYAVAAADFGISKSRFVRHANALSRLSVTALAPEAYLALKAYEDAMAKQPARIVHSNAALATTGYNPSGGQFFGRTSDRFKTYHKTKWIGAGLRLIANRTRIGRAIMRPIRENVLKELGGSV